MADEIFGDIPDRFALRELEMKEMDWNCDCSEERLEKVLTTIGEKDLKGDHRRVTAPLNWFVSSAFKKYHFDKAHLERILENIRT